MAEIRDNHPYIAKSHPVRDIPVYEVQQDNIRAKSKLFHRNMLLSFNGLPISQGPIHSKPSRQHVTIYDNEYSSSTEDTQDATKRKVHRYVIPHRRKLETKPLSEDSSCGSFEEASAPERELSQERNQPMYKSDQNAVIPDNRPALFLLVLPAVIKDHEDDQDKDSHQNG